MQAIQDLQIEPILGIVETHCHLNDAHFDFDRDSVIQRARTAGIREMLVDQVLGESSVAPQHGLALVADL